MSIKQAPSPNFNKRADGACIKYIVLHYTGMETAAEAIDKLRDPSSQVSAHYLINEDGSIIQFVSEADRAWHAGHSYWRGERDLNSLSIGIELVNPGHALGYQPYPPAQIQALEELVSDIMHRYNLPAESVLAHSDIAPMRKDDPGELMPWKELASKGIGLWPSKTDAPAPNLSECEIADCLEKIGYSAACGSDDFYAAVSAFQRRYRPDLIDGTLDDETRALIIELEKLMR